MPDQARPRPPSAWSGLRVGSGTHPQVVRRAVFRDLFAVGWSDGNGETLPLRATLVATNGLPTTGVEVHALASFELFARLLRGQQRDRPLGSESSHFQHVVRGIERAAHFLIDEYRVGKPGRIERAGLDSIGAGRGIVVDDGPAGLGGCLARFV